MIVERDAGRRRKRRQPRLAEFEREAAAARDLHRVGQGCRHIGKQCGHLGSGLEVLLARETSRSTWIGERVALGDAVTRFVCAEVIRSEKLDRVGGHDGQMLLERQGQRRVRAGHVARVARALQFEIEAARKQRRQPLCGQYGGIGPAGHQMRADFAVPCTGQRNQPRCARSGVGLEPLESQFRTVAMLVFEEGPRQQRAEIQVPGAILRQQQQAVGVVAVDIVRDPDVAAENRLDPLAPCSLVEAHRAKDIGTVRQGQSALAVRRRLGHHIVDAHDAVDNRELRMQAKVDELRTAHDKDSATRRSPPLWISGRVSAFMP